MDISERIQLHKSGVTTYNKVCKIHGFTRFYSSNGGCCQCAAERQLARRNLAKAGVSLGAFRCRTGAELPVMATDGSACYDLYAAIDAPVTLHQGVAQTITTGIKLLIPARHHVKIHSRSGMGFKNGIRLANSTGIIDRDFTGEIQVRLVMDNEGSFTIHNGDRIAQLELVETPKWRIEELTEDRYEKGKTLITSSRAGGFGSTGK